MNEQQIINSSLWAALGDALGYVTERGNQSTFAYRLHGEPDHWGTAPWRRKIGGQYGCMVELSPGTYSDDTQLRLSVSRSINAEGVFQKEAFAKIELPLWRCYALGAGVGSLAAAENLVKSTINWNSNEFKNKKTSYYESGGNGASMRIQPHVWAASNWQHPLLYLQDVVSNALITHGHPRGILGAAFHAICLAMTLANKKPLSQPLWIETLPFLKSIPSLIEKDFALSSVWLTRWQTENAIDFAAQVAKVIEEFKVYFEEFLHHKEGSPKERYYSFAKAIQAVGGKERGSAVKTSVLASAAALIFKDDDPLYCLRTVASLFDSDTDTIATMTGALLGAAAENEPPLPIQDKEYLKSEARRMACIAQGIAAETFTYPSIFTWKSPRSPLDLVVRYQENFYLNGLSQLTFFGQEYYTHTTVWQWAQLPFGQTILAKRRKDTLLTLKKPMLGKYTKIDGNKEKQPLQYKHKKNIEAARSSSQISLFGIDVIYNNTDWTVKINSLDDIKKIVDFIEKQGFLAQDIGRAYLYIENSCHDFFYISEFFSLLYKRQNKYY